MNGSSLFGGESFGTLYENGATFKQSSTTSTEVFLNVTEEKGVFVILSSSGNAIVNITVDGSSFQGTIAQISNLTGGNLPTLASYIVYKRSVRVETINNTSSHSVTVERLS